MYFFILSKSLKNGTVLRKIPAREFIAGGDFY